MPLRLSSLNIKHVTCGRVEGGWGEEEETGGVKGKEGRRTDGKKGGKEDGPESQ